MARKYGVPYMGSKNDIAEDIINILPPADTFYDLFAGGCAITHCAMLSGKYKRFVVNDIDWRGITLFKDAIAGKYHNEKRIIDREYFHTNKETDAYVALCWSFGNSGKSYLYGENVEELKLSAQRMIMADTWQERYHFFLDFIRVLERSLQNTTPQETVRIRVELRRIQSLGVLERLQWLESLQRLESLQQMKSLIGDYKAVNIARGGVVYCDPPYKDTCEYASGKFDHDAFYEWIRTRDFPVYVSEYSMPDDFTPIWGVSKAVLLQGGSNNTATERLFVHEKWKDIIPKHELF